MTSIITAPSVSANEDTLTLSRWYRADGEFITKGEIVCGVETTKATVDIEAEVDGYLSRIATEGALVAVGSPIAALTEKPGEDVRSAIEADGTGTGNRRWTRKAAIVAKRLGVDIARLADGNAGRTVTEQDVLAAHEGGKPATAPAAAIPRTPPTRGAAGNRAPSRVEDLYADAFPANQPERILLLGGGAGAGAMAVDVLSRTHAQRAVAILDGNAATHGKTVGGVPVLGDLSLIDELLGENAFDAAVILFTQDVDERGAVFDALRAKGVRFANLIDPSVQIRGGTTLGEGNLVMANVFFSTAVTIGDNCFFASHCVIEHHSRIGSHCAFGPRTAMSGAVTVGDHVKTGMSVSIEPYVTIGSDCLIASGCVITCDVPAHSLVKAQQTHSIHPRRKATS